MLKMQELSEYEKNPVMLKSLILQTHKAFMEAVYVLKNSMVDVLVTKQSPYKKRNQRTIFHQFINVMKDKQYIYVHSVITKD